jgi:hypothetical protein
MAIVFDASSKRIILDSSSVTATEIYSRSCDWLLLSDNSKYGAVFRQVGSDDLGGGLSIPPYFFLQGAWRVRPMESSHNLTITGNLFVEGGGVPVVSTLGTYQVNVNYTVPVQAQGISTTGAASPWGETIEGSYTAAQIMRLLGSIAAGKTYIVDNGNGTTHVEFRNISDTKVLLAATMTGSVRTTVTTDLT